MSNNPVQGTPEQVLAFIKAFVKMQGSMGSVPKEAEGQVGTSRKFKYADFESVVSYCRPFFRENGFAHLELCGAGEGEATVTAILVHESGGWVQSSFSWPAKGHQEIGQGQTYFRRYGLSGLAGLSSGDDTDAEGLQPPQQPQRARQEPAKQQAKTQVDPQAILDDIKRFVKSKAKTSDQEKDFLAQVAAHAQDAHGMVPSVLAQKGMVYKLDEVLRWAKENIGQPPAPGTEECDRERVLYEQNHDETFGEMR